MNTSDPSAAPPPPVPAGSPSKEERTWAMACHLSMLAGFVIPFGHVIGPLVVWILKKDEFALVDDQGKEALNFAISITLYGIAAGILCLVLIGMVLVPVLLIAALVLLLIAAVKANEGVAYRYPAIFRFIR